MGFLSFLGVLSPAHISLFTAARRGSKVGMDNAGNTYYEAAPIKGYKNSRRWVIYKGSPDASKVPPQWHGWLHHQSDNIPSDDNDSYRQPWQKPHQENMSGTNKAYRPSGHILSGCDREQVSADYIAWQPPK